jgi:hypothetical protein
VTLGRAAGTAVDTERRAALNGAKLAALVAERWGGGDRLRGALGATATLTQGASGWVLPDGDPSRALGPALAWADRHGVADLHVVAEAGLPAGVLARQASLFADGPTVWAVQGTALAADPAAPAPPPARLSPPAPPELVDLLLDAGLEVVVEGGQVRGEINGLEVARIVHGTTTAGVPIDEPLLEVGVGKADRELTAMVHGGLAPVDQLARVGEIVRTHRHPGAPRHPLNQLVPERWLRAVLCRDPGPVGLASLRPAEGARARANLSERDIAVAAGETAGGEPVVVACSVGIALDLVPSAADARLALDAVAGRSAPSRLLLAVPERDDHPGTRRVGARLRAPAEVIPVPGDWRAAA